MCHVEAFRFLLHGKGEHHINSFLFLHCRRDAMAETVEELTPLKQKLEDFGQFLSKARPVWLRWLFGVVQRPNLRCPAHA